MEEYMSYMGNIDTLADSIYRYLNFNEIQSYMDAAERAKSIPLTSIQEVAV